MREESISLGNRQYTLYINDNTFETYASSASERHSHATFEVHIVLSGEARIYIDDKSFELSSGESVLVLPGQHHSFDKEMQNFKHFTLSFSPVRSKETLQNDMHFFTEKLLLSEFENSLCNKIIVENKRKMPYMSESIKLLYCALLIEVLRKRQSFDFETKKKNAETISADKRLSIIDTFFENCFGEDATETRLAEMCNLSRRQLWRVLKVHYGQSFREKLRSTRMDFAAWLLLTSEYSVGEISRISGYKSETSFLRTFKEYFGKTPTQYRTNKYPPAIEVNPKV